LNKIELSAEKAIELTKDIQQLTYRLPKSQQLKTKLLNLDQKQKKLIEMIQK
jgi:hypothetical protein